MRRGTCFLSLEPKRKTKATCVSRFFFFLILEMSSDVLEAGVTHAWSYDPASNKSRKTPLQNENQSSTLARK